MPGKNFYFCDKITMSDHTPYNFPHGNGDPQHFNVLRCYHAYQSVSVAVAKKLPCQRERSNSEDLLTVARMTGKLIVGREKFLQFA